jgi:hypothetical protein
MKSGRCPKCGGGRIATSEYAMYLGNGISGPSISLYACADCRYLEQYVKEDIEQRVKVLDSWRWLVKDDGPFRSQGSTKAKRNVNEE